jgi:acetyl esterase/lipase
MRLKSNFFLALAATILFGSCSTNYIEQEIKYKTKDSHQFEAELYSPKNTTGKLPLVVVIHGGGWTNRSGDMVSLSKHIAESGMIALNITYRLAPKVRYPIQVDDVKSVFTWINANADKYNIDKDRIFTWGYSAGAHLAFILGNQKDLELPIKGIVVGGIPSYLPGYPKSPLITELMGMSFEADPKAWNAASPISFVSQKTPPTFVYHGADDSLVGVDQAELLVKKLNEVGIRNQFHVVENMGHMTVYFFSKESEDKGIEFLNAIK